MDGAAFVLIYTALDEESWWRRFSWLAAAIAGSLLFPLAFSSVVATNGLSGLSGAAHGIMVVAALELFTRYPKGDGLRTAGVILFVLVAAKVVIEAATGSVLFSKLHFGDVGVPIPVSHLGGVVGGVVGYLIVNRMGFKWMGMLVPSQRR
jgi:hypothetical protein